MSPVHAIQRLFRELIRHVEVAVVFRSRAGGAEGERVTWGQRGSSRGQRGVWLVIRKA